MRITYPVVATTLFLLFFSKSASADPFTDQVLEGLRTRLEAAQPTAWRVGNDLLYTQVATSTFYTRRAFVPAWLKRCPEPAAHALRNAIGDAASHGLLPENYHLAKIDRHLSAAQDCHRKKWPATEAVELELLLTDAFFLYTGHLVGGRLNPIDLDPDWQAQRREIDLVALLDSVMAGKTTLGSALTSVLPNNPQYELLQNALKKYRSFEKTGGWDALPTDTNLTSGDRGSAFNALYERLLAERLVVGASSGTYDETVEVAVRQYQARVGLKTTGAVDAQTLAELNVSAAARARQIELSLERWRWLPQNLGTRHIFLNIPEFSLRAVEGDRTVLELKAIVGRPYRQTPMLSSNIGYLVLSPTWTVPPTILSQDLVPRMKKERDFFRKTGMTLYHGWGSEARRIDPKSINWSRVSTKNFRYRVVQKPGRNNALGRVKFMFPNPHGVYIHDTPSRELFGESERTFSSGCIRIEEPLQLAAWLLRDTRAWPVARLKKESRRRNERTVRLPTAIDVHLAYLTAWVDTDKQIHFRRDIYQRDEKLMRALNRTPQML